VARNAATVALVCGLLSVLFSALIVPGLLAIVFGLLARRERPSRRATAGIVLGVVTVAAGGWVWVTFWPKIFHSPSYRTLAVGDCYERPDNDPRYVERQSCDGQHGREVVALLDHPAGPGLSYPGIEAIRRDMDPECRRAAEAYVGGTLDQSPLRTFRIYPSRESWNDGNRRVVCALGSRDRKPLIGSLQNRRLAAS
jgi:hypothetical protein